MPAPPHVLADRAGRAVDDPTISGWEADGQPHPQLYTVPLHEPSTDWPGPRAALEAGAEQDGAPVRYGAELADPADGGQAWPRQFAVLLTEALAGVRPVRQLLPWLSDRGRAHLHRLLPLFADGHQPRITRVLTMRPAQDVIEMTLVVAAGPRTRALAVRLERSHPARTYPVPGPTAGPPLSPRVAGSPARPAARWHCTDIEAA